MTIKTMGALALVALVLTPAGAFARETSGFGLTVLMDDMERTEYSARGTVYVEAVRGKSYEVRLTNPHSYRVAVALSVDGLNSIDAKHTSAGRASKWVIDPYDSIVISGWQVSDQAARQFFFTGEHSSYGAALGQTENLGIIEAVFFREKVPIHTYLRPYEEGDSAGSAGQDSSKRSERQAPKAGAGSVMMPQPKDSSDALSDEYAATGMGNRRDHEVERIEMQLEKEPMARVRIRYEFRPQLVKLGVFPRSRSTIQRREQASGFEAYCPEMR